jgi:hypothetical protein
MVDWETGVESGPTLGRASECSICGDRVQSRQEYCRECVEEIEDT